MTRQTEDTMYAIHTELTESKLWSEFNAQLKKMNSQEKHKWKSSVERWEYTLKRIKEK